MQDDLEGTTLPATCVALSGGFKLAECIDADGEATIWVLSPAVDADPGDAGPHYAPHEQDGSLPREYRRRLGLVCGAITRSKKPCNTLVKTFGGRCGHHQGEPDAEPELEDPHRDGRLF